MNAFTASPAALGFTPLFVVPEGHPSQEGLPPHEREAAVARSLGAEWTDKGCMRAGPRAAAEEVRALVGMFGGDGAKRRAALAAADFAPKVGRKALALAAAAEVAAAGGTPPRVWIQDDPAPGRRTHLHAVPTPHLRFSAKRLDALLAEHGIEAGIEEDASTGLQGRRYVSASAALPDEIAAFASPQAAKAVEDWAARRRESDDLAASVANSLAAGASGLRRPVVVPTAGSDAEAAAQIHAALRSAPPERLAALESATRREADLAARRTGSRAAAAVLRLESGLAAIRAVKAPAPAERAAPRRPAASKDAKAQGPRGQE